MKKQWLIMVALFMAVCMLAACGKTQEAGVSSEAEEQVVQDASAQTDDDTASAAQDSENGDLPQDENGEEEEQIAQEEIEKIDSEISSIIQDVEDENPVQDFVGEMDLEGSWQDEVSQRAMMKIQKNDDGSYDIVVTWGGSAFTAAQWEIHGYFDETSGMLSYEDGAYAGHTWDEDGNETISDEKTTQGAFFKEGEKLRWSDSENSEDGVFVKIE